jgi:indole-3-glycerol phosphate synthase
VSKFLTDHLRRKRWENDHLRAMLRKEPRIDPAEPWLPSPAVIDRARALLKAGGAEGGRRPITPLLQREHEITVLAEVVRRTPWSGRVAGWEDPVPLAQDLAQGGAAALSVVTDAHAADGSPAFLPRVRDAVTAPVLRRDLVMDEVDVAVSRALGSDGVHLLAAALGPELPRLLALCRSFDVEAIVEVHDERDLERALIAGATLLCIRHRHPQTLWLDPDTTERLAPRVPAPFPVVADAGRCSPEDAMRLRGAGADTILAGEGLQRLTLAEEHLRLAGLREARAGGVVLPSPLRLRAEALRMPGARGNRA